MHVLEILCPLIKEVHIVMKMLKHGENPRPYPFLSYCLQPLTGGLFLTLPSEEHLREFCNAFHKGKWYLFPAWPLFVVPQEE